MTFSIIGINKKKRELGIAIYSKSFAAGACVPAVDLNSGAVATQAYPNVSYKEEGLRLMNKFSPEKAIQLMISKDKNREFRQVMLMNKKGESFAFTGRKNTSWAGSLKGKNCICAGNTLVGERVMPAMVNSFENTKGSLAERLLSALKSAEKVGGDKRHIKFNSAGLIVEKYKCGELKIGNRYIDLRVDNSTDSLAELSKLLKEQRKLEKKYS